jgi:hypothetical protein
MPKAPRKIHVSRYKLFVVSSIVSFFFIFSSRSFVPLPTGGGSQGAGWRKQGVERRWCWAERRWDDPSSDGTGRSGSRTASSSLVLASTQPLHSSSKEAEVGGTGAGDGGSSRRHRSGGVGRQGHRCRGRGTTASPPPHLIVAAPNQRGQAPVVTVGWDADLVRTRHPYFSHLSGELLQRGSKKAGARLRRSRGIWAGKGTIIGVKVTAASPPLHPSPASQSKAEDGELQVGHRSSPSLLLCGHARMRFPFKKNCCIF